MISLLQHGLSHHMACGQFSYLRFFEGCTKYPSARGVDGGGLSVLHSFAISTWSISLPHYGELHCNEQRGSEAGKRDSKWAVLLL
jgi:hypothetical protein